MILYHGTNMDFAVIEGTLTIAELAKELKYRKLNNQYFFGAEKAIKLLRRL